MTRSTERMSAVIGNGDAAQKPLNIIRRTELRQNLQSQKSSQHLHFVNVTNRQQNSSKAHTTPTPPLILPHHHLRSLCIHQTPLSATIRRQPLDKLRQPRMRINAPVHRKRLYLRIHTLLADLHITIRIERHHRTVDLPLRTRRHLHIPQLPPPASTAQTKSPANNTHLQTSKPKIKVNANADHPPPKHLSMKIHVIVSPPPPNTPLLPQRSQILLMQMIILHHEQHIRHRKQRQCHKQVNPMPSHKRKPTSRLKNRTKENEPN